MHISSILPFWFLVFVDKFTEYFNCNDEDPEKLFGAFFSSMFLPWVCWTIIFSWKYCCEQDGWNITAEASPDRPDVNGIPSSQTSSNGL